MDEDEMEELMIVAAGQHRVRFDLKLTVAPPINVDDLAAEEQQRLEQRLEKVIKAALEGEPVLQHKGREYRLILNRMDRRERGIVTEPW